MSKIRFNRNEEGLFVPVKDKKKQLTVHLYPEELDAVEILLKLYRRKKIRMSRSALIGNVIGIGVRRHLEELEKNAKIKK